MAARLTAEKSFCAMEQGRFVASQLQLRTTDPPALPQSNPIEVTLFVLVAQRQ
jgi:hypothetical protein